MGKRWNLEAMNNFCKSNNSHDGYEVLEIKRVEKPYQNQLWSLIKCPNDNHEAYWVCWNNFTRGDTCKQCFYEEKQMTIWTKDLAYNFFEEHGYKVICINDWRNVDKTVWCYDKYGFKVQASISNLKRKNSSPSPFQYNKFALENIKLFCKLFRQNYDIISEKYDKIKSEYQWIYKGTLPSDTNPIFIQTADSFINGGRVHPYLSKTNGNIIFENELIIHNIEYIMEKTFPDCRDKAVLRFDFYLPNTNEIFEIDGLQHEKPIEYFGGEKQFIDTVKKDNIKNKYCQDNNIKITRIPYRTNKVIEFKELVNQAIQNINTTIGID